MPGYNNSYCMNDLFRLKKIQFHLVGRGRFWLSEWKKLTNYKVIPSCFRGQRCLETSCHRQSEVLMLFYKSLSWVHSSDTSIISCIKSWGGKKTNLKKPPTVSMSWLWDFCFTKLKSQWKARLLNYLTFFIN